MGHHAKYLSSGGHTSSLQRPLTRPIRNEASSGDRLQTTLQHVRTENKKFHKNKPTKVCRPNQGVPRSYLSKASLYSRTRLSVHKREKTGLLEPPGSYKGVYTTGNNVQLDTAVTLTKSASRDVFYPAPLDKAGAPAYGGYSVNTAQIAHSHTQTPDPHTTVLPRTSQKA